MICPCGTGNEYSECCEPYITGEKLAPTPEALMRSRYTAYVKNATAFLRSSLTPETRSDFRESDVKEWSQAEWLGLEILNAKGNTVEFQAKYRTDGKVYEHHEVSKFKKIGDQWFFASGDHHVHEEGQGHHHHHEPQVPVVRESPKIGRNDPCTCGSGKKYKKCCGTAA